MIRNFILVFIIIVTTMFLLILTNKSTKKEKFKRETSKIIYQASKAMIIFLISMILFSWFDLAKLIGIMPENDISLNVTIYTLFLVLLFSLLEKIFKENQVIIEIVLSSTKNIDPLVKETIKVAHENPSQFYMFVTIEGNINKLADYKIEIQFPKDISAQIDENLSSDYENKLIIDISKYISSNGRTLFTIDVVKEIIPTESEKYLEATIVKEKKLFQALFINQTSNKIGLISE